VNTTLTVDKAREVRAVGLVHALREFIDAREKLRVRDLHEFGVSERIPDWVSVILAPCYGAVGTFNKA
jgi:hypothetical protein